MSYYDSLIIVCIIIIIIAVSVQGYRNKNKFRPPPGSDGKPQRRIFNCVNEMNALRENVFSNKADIVISELSEYMQVISYEKEKHIEKQQIIGTQLIEKWNKCAGSDLLKVKYKGVNITFSDLALLGSEADKRGNVYFKQRFKGQWIIIETSKEIKRQLRLRERIWSTEEEMPSDIETENLEFNKKYQILVSDPHTAFYILTPHFMEYLLNMEKEANARTFFCFVNLFDKNQVHVALHNNRDLFESGLGIRIEPHQLAEFREKVKKEVGYIKSILDELLLNNYLFKGED